jgi:hypothetical protein
MDLWFCSSVTHTCLEGLVKRNLLRATTEVMEWLMPTSEDAPTPPNGYVMSFTPFHEHGLMIPPHKFLRGLLHH